MTHGTPDWWGSEPGETTFQVQDVGELAVRLGSIDSFDRRGNVTWLNDFESGLARTTQYCSGSGGYAQLSALASRSGAYSAKLYTGTGAGNMGQVYVQLPPPVESNVGLEGWVRWFQGQHIVGLEIDIDDGVNAYSGYLRYDFSTKKIQYIDAAGVWQDLETGVNLYGAGPIWHAFKLAINLPEREYRYYIVNDYEGSMAGIGLEPYASSGHKAFNCYVYAEGNGALATGIYVDDMIITQNEP